MHRLHSPRNLYPNQYWLLFWGNLISTIGTSMIWPFLMIYVSGKLDLPLTAIASLLTINSAMGLLSTFIAGPIIDRIGRKAVMVIGLTLLGTNYLLYNLADSLLFFAVLMGISGMVGPIYRVGADAMVADLVAQEKRADAYALLRMGNNAGIALGPSIGGLIASQSYTIAFFCGAIGMLIYGAVIFLFAKETLKKPVDIVVKPEVVSHGYHNVFKDKLFLFICLATTITTIAASMVFVLLSVYAKQQYQVPESQFGFIMATNAGIVVLFQVLVTRVTKRLPPFPVMVFGAFFYSLGVGSVAMGKSFLAFIFSVVIMTIGEMALVPTTTTLVSNLAPMAMRGRYMSIYGLSWAIASGIGPILGGFLNDNIAPVAIWYGGGSIGLFGALMFLILALKKPAMRQQET